MIECRVLGPVEVTVNGRAAPAELLWRHNLALLVYLARSPRRRRTRAHLRGLLWPDKPEQAAGSSLKQALYEIRRSLGANDLQTEGDHVRLATDAVRLDTEQFETLTGAHDWQGAADLVCGLFLDGFELPESSAFENWLIAERRDWGARSVDALLRQTEFELGRGRAGAAARAAGKALRIAPLSETAVMSLMRAQTLEGDRAGALREYESLKTSLANELGTQPSHECDALAERIRRERGRSRPPAREAEPEPRRARLIARTDELERLWTLWQRASAAGTSACGLIVGDPGTGKTRLGDELALRIRLAGATTAVIRAVESDLADPWSGLVGLGRGGLLDAAGLAAAPPSALAWFAERISEWADRFAAARAITPEVSPTRAFSEVLRAALVEQPVALVVDDAALLDRESLLAIDAVLRDHTKHPLFVVLSISVQAGRPEIDELRARIGRDVNGVVVQLTPFGSDEVAALARWILPHYSDEQLDRLIRRVSTDSAGVPVLVVELLSAVAVGLDLDRTRGAWPEPLRTLDDTLPGNLPEGVIGAIRVWFRRLSQAAQHVLQAVAVLEDRVTAERLAGATALPLEVVIEALDKLEWDRWLTFESRGYAFGARIVRQVVAQDLVTPGQRQRILNAAGPAPVKHAPSS